MCELPNVGLANTVTLHALWHLVSAYAFIVIWAFNHQRFSQLGAA